MGSSVSTHTNTTQATHSRSRARWGVSDDVCWPCKLRFFLDNSAIELFANARSWSVVSIWADFLSRWNNKDCEAVVRQLQTYGLDAAQRRRWAETSCKKYNDSTALKGCGTERNLFKCAFDIGSWIKFRRMRSEPQYDGVLNHNGWQPNETPRWTMAITKHGTRVVQAALDVADLPEKLNLVASLRGRVWWLGIQDGYMGGDLVMLLLIEEILHHLGCIKALYMRSGINYVWTGAGFFCIKYERIRKGVVSR